MYVSLTSNLARSETVRREIAVVLLFIFPSQPYQCWLMGPISVIKLFKGSSTLPLPLKLKLRTRNTNARQLHHAATPRFRTVVLYAVDAVRLE